MKWPFLEFFGLWLPQILFNFVEIFTRVSILVYKNTIWIIFKKLKFLQKWDRPKVCFFSPTLTPRFTLKMVRIKESKKMQGKNSAIWLSNYVKAKSLSPLPLKWKTGLLFALFGHFWAKNRVWSKVKCKI